MKDLLLLPALFALFSIGFSPFPFNSDAPGQIVSDQSKVTFSIGHATGRVNGSFTGMAGTVVFDENNLAASHMEVTLEANTINAENRARDSDLRKERFFHTEQYPQISFRSKEVTRSDGGFLVRGDLTIKDQTREAVIPFTYEKKEGEAVFTGSFTVNRKDFNLGRSAFPPIGKVAKVTILAVVR